MTPRKSARAEARRQYLAMPGRDLVFALAPEAGQGAKKKVEGQGLQESAPTPDPSPRLADARGGGEKEGSGRGESTERVETPSLMARVQGLYEDPAVPVREIARLCGVTERTIYKYAARGGWRGRYAVKPVKGSGGRFVARGPEGEQVAPVVRGLKALDPSGRARASVACAAASVRGAKARERARAKADAAQVWEARRRAIDSVSAAMAAYSRWREGRARRAALFFYEGGPNDAGRADDARTEAMYVAQIEAALACVRKLKM